MNRNFDFSGLDFFLQISEILKSDKSPGDKLWDSMFSTPGYSILIQNEFNRDFFINTMQTAFKPSEKARLDVILKNRQKESRFIEHYIYIDSIKNQIAAFKEKILASLLEKQVVKYVKEYLPPCEVDNLPLITFLVFDNDARGYDPVVLDIGFSMSLGESLPLLLSHEIHHNIRNKTSTMSINRLSEFEGNIFQALNQIHLEGIADQIDKEVLLNEPNIPRGLEAYAKKFWESVNEAPKIISQINDFFSEIYCSPDKVKLSERLYDIIPLSGHPLGFYMAKIILNHSGKDLLVKDIANPFAFFRKYNEAAIKLKDTSLFSSQAINLINALEEKCLG